VFLLKEMVNGWAKLAGGRIDKKGTDLQNFGYAGRGVSQRRKDWGEFRQAKNCSEKVGGCRSFAFPADAAVLRVFKDYTTIRQCFTDAVGGGKVARLPGSLALGDEFLDLRVIGARRF
jgi:hypothetical protein